MFTGIIEHIGTVVFVETKNGNMELKISVAFAIELKKGESVSHNGVCLTVEEIFEKEYSVTLVSETLLKSNLGSLKKGDLVNLERAMLASSRFDGHFVQGHVDCIAKCVDANSTDGSTVFTFDYEEKHAGLLVEKGSICINGVSLTIAELAEKTFSVAIIPFTKSHTNFNFLSKGDNVNLEFDVLGKYVARQFSAMQTKIY